MKRIGTRPKALLLATIVAAGLFAWWSVRASTPPIRGPNGERSSASIATLEKVRLGGVDQWILVRGHDRGNPLILFLHGGPGMPSMYLAHAFQRDLERDFTVVHWDRRGSGKSYSRRIVGESLAVSQQLADTIELVDLLRARYGRPRIYLIGHSWGSLLGILAVSRRPDLFEAYVGIGQVVDDAEARRLQLEFIKREATARGDLEALEDIDAHPGLREKYLFQYGGELERETSWWPLLLMGLRSPEYSFWDSLKVPKGVSFSHANTRDDVLRGQPIREAVHKLAIPVWFFAGRRDYVSPSELVVGYVAELEAPRKEVIWFEHSAHFPFLEESERFVAEIEKVREIVEHETR